MRGATNGEPRLDILGAALADPTRAGLLCMLVEGRAFTNKELAARAGVTAQTATVHLQKLADAGLTVPERSGRHVYHRIAGEEVATALESLAAIAPSRHIVRAGPEVRLARSCYRHLAGALGVAVAERCLARGFLAVEGTGYQVTVSGAAAFATLGLEAAGLRARPCLDWTERKHHLAGPLATALLARALDQGWLLRQAEGRALVLSSSGAAALGAVFGDGMPR